MDLTTSSRASTLRTVLLTVTAMIAFAANSLLCRMALGQEMIDAASFTMIRIVAGAVTLIVIVSLRGGTTRLRPHWSSVAALFGYMVFFSFAYLSLTAGTGALLLFGAVQLTMFIAAIRSGERFSVLAWAGLCAAFAGLVYLVAPGVAAGSIASGLGYAVWYAALPNLTAGRAATVQLSVPAIAALGGVLLLSEHITLRLVVASSLTIGGIWLVLAQRSRRIAPTPEKN